MEEDSENILKFHSLSFKILLPLHLEHNFKLYLIVSESLTNIKPR
uniref:Uncharacterized protein n=1 Tax=Rhizophora mucronata TaxID=61149 RepID=A0A2P2P194_RHIMU